MIGSRAVGPTSVGSWASGAAQYRPVNPPRAAPGRPRLCLSRRPFACAADDPLRPRRRAISLCALSRGGDLNALESQLRRALAKEDYAAAAALRDTIAAASGVAGSQGSWEALGVPAWLADRASQLGFAIPTAIQRAAVPAVLSGRDVLLTSRPGSGKSLAFLLPALARLFPLEESDLEESDLEPRPLGPLLIVMAPARDLGKQLAILVSKLLGGPTRTSFDPGSESNLFRYRGPRGVVVRGLLLPDELEAVEAAGGLAGAHILVGTPDLIAKAVAGAKGIVEHAEILVVDEADACVQTHLDSLRTILPVLGSQRRRPCQRILVGASLADGVGAWIEQGWVDADALQCNVHDASSGSSLTRHYVIAVPEEEQRLPALCRELRAQHTRHADSDASELHDSLPRILILINDEGLTLRAGQAIRGALWDLARLTVLLSRGAASAEALGAFRAGQSSLLVSTPAAVRGLDLPMLDAVFMLGCPDSPAAYVHAAGRVGRIGQSGTHKVVTVVASGEEEMRLRAITRAAGVALETAEAAPAQPLSELDGLQNLKKALEDLYDLY